MSVPPTLAQPRALPPGVSSALVMDVDGVVSAVHPERDAWGDEVIAGHLFGPVRVSPTLCRRLDVLGSLPHVVPLWLTSWAPDSRLHMDPFPGRSWQTLSTHEAAEDRSVAGGPKAFSRDQDRLDWWKWDVVRTWLDDYPQIRSLVWCDDHLGLPLWKDDPELNQAGGVEAEVPRVSPARWALEPEDEPFLTTMSAVIGERLEMDGVVATLIAPNTEVGLLPEDVDRVETALLAAARSGS